MQIRGLIDEDFTNYKKASMMIIFPYCTFKCDKENGNQICQNCSIIKEPLIDISKEELYLRYQNNPITKSFVLAGLEPFDSPLDLLTFIDSVRTKFHCDDDIVIYTGYTEEELSKGEIFQNNPIYQNLYNSILKYNNIIIKYGRFIPNQEKHFDDILGVNLASPNQYAKIYNKN